MDSRDPTPPHELAFAVEQSEEDIASKDPSGADGSQASLTAGTDEGAAATAGVSTTNVELAIRVVGEDDRSHSFDGMESTADGAAAAATGADSNMVPNDSHDGSDPSRTSSTIDSHQEQGTAAVTNAAAHRSKRQRRCRGCDEWWQSSAGGKSGVFSVVLGVIIVLYATLIVALPFQADALTGLKGTAETYLQLTMSVNVVVGSICGLLFLFAVWTIRRATCARKSTLEDIAKTAEARRHSKWFGTNMFELLQEGKGPNSPYV